MPSLFAGPFPRQGCLHSFLLSWFEVKRMLFYFFDNVLLLDLTLETSEGAFQRLSLLQSNFGQTINTPISTRNYLSTLLS